MTEEKPRVTPAAGTLPAETKETAGSGEPAIEPGKHQDIMTELGFVPGASGNFAGAGDSAAGTGKGAVSPGPHFRFFAPPFESWHANGPFNLSAQTGITEGQTKADSATVLPDGTTTVDRPPPNLDGTTPSEQELAAMQALLDNPDAKLEIHTTTEDKQNGLEPDIIIDKNGVAHLNPNKKNASADGAVMVEVESDDNARQAAIAANEQQKATVRDLIGYFEMEHPGAPVPDEWLKVLASSPDLPSPQPHQISPSRAGSGFSGGVGGSPGAISTNIPRAVPSGVPVGRPSSLENQLAPRLKDSLNLHNFVDRVVSALSRNEGSFTSINPNDSGYGISVGIRQWNQKAGELPTLLKAWHDQDPSKFNSIFGQYAPKLLNQSWVRNTNFAAQPGLVDDLKSALADKEFQDVQVKLARDFVVEGIQLGMKYGFKSELGLAEVVDITNQRGFGGAESALKSIGGAGGNEQAAIQRLEQAAHRPGGQRRLASLESQFSSRTAVDS